MRALLSDAKARFLTRGGSQSEQVQVQEWAQQWAKQAERLADKLLVSLFAVLLCHDRIHPWGPG